MLELTPSQRELQDRLVEAIREAFPVEEQLDVARQRAHTCYRQIAEILVTLRHECPGSNGEPYDLRGRSFLYRSVVRHAYVQVGAELGAPIPKRLTAGVAYWVRKLLIERYGEAKLYELGVLRGPVPGAHQAYARVLSVLPDDPIECLSTVIGILNALVVDPGLTPTEEVVRSAMRAVTLLQGKLNYSTATAL